VGSALADIVIDYITKMISW
jgi:hypothetical protein